MTRMLQEIELADAAGLSVAATAERLRRLREAGVVRAVVVQLDATRLGYAVRAMIGITVQQPHKQAFLTRLRAAPEVLECHHVTGTDSYLISVVSRDLADLEEFVGTLNPFGETRTFVVFSTPIERRAIVPPGRVRQAQ